MSIIEEIAELIENKHVTAYEIFKHTGISQATLSRLFTGKTKRASHSTLKILSKYLQDYNRYGREGMISPVVQYEFRDEDGEQGLRFEEPKPINPDKTIDPYENMTLENYKELVRLLRKENAELKSALGVCQADNQRLKKNT